MENWLKRCGGVSGSNKCSKINCAEGDITLHMFCAVSSRSVICNLCDPVDCSPPASSVHGIVQARILEWVAMPTSRGSSQPRD